MTGRIRPVAAHTHQLTPALLLLHLLAVMLSLLTAPIYWLAAWSGFTTPRASTILLTGGTGYIGGTVLTSLLTRYPSSSITVLVRPETDPTPFQSLGVHILTATDQSSVANVAKYHDIVIHEASASNIEWIKGLIAGQEERAESSKIKPIFMYGGGTGVMVDRCHGDHLSEHIWSDYDYKSLDSLPPTAMHREGDLLATAAAKRGIIEVYHLSPGLVYGRGTGPVRRISTQIPALVKIALDRKEAVYFGKGVGIWGPDLADSFLFLLDRALSKPSTYPEIKTGWETFHSVEVPSESMTWKEISEAIGDALYEVAKVDAPGAVSVPFGTETGFGNGVLSDCARSLADRLNNLGWNAKQKSLKETIEGDAKDVLDRL